MGAISDNVNSISLTAATEAELSSKPTGSLRRGDIGWVDEHYGDPAGPYFFYDPRSDEEIAPGLSIAAKGGGRWLSLKVFGFRLPPRAGTVENHLTVDTAIATTGTVLATTGAIVALLDGVYDITASAAVTMGASATEVGFVVEKSIDDGATWEVVPCSGTSASCAANKSTSAAIVVRAPATQGEVAKFRILATSDNASAACKPVTAAGFQHAAIRVSYVP